MTIVIIDYGMGNLRSVEKAFTSIGANTLVSASPDEIRSADKIILPGVGAFGDAMEELNRGELVKPIREAVERGKPFLGICLGLQVLFESSEENPGVKGLGIVKGTVNKFKNVKKVPHMGWNRIYTSQEAPIFEGIDDGSFFYFVHSYFAQPTETSVIATTSLYGRKFCSSIWKENLFATQFHPEKSQKDGLRIIENFASL